MLQGNVSPIRRPPDCLGPRPSLNVPQRGGRLFNLRQERAGTLPNMDAIRM